MVLVLPIEGPTLFTFVIAISNCCEVILIDEVPPDNTFVIYAKKILINQYN